MKNSLKDILIYMLAMSVLWVLLGFYLLTMVPLWGVIPSLGFVLLSLPSGYVLMNGIALIDRQLRAEIGVKGYLEYKNEIGINGAGRDLKLLFFKLILMLFPVFVCVYAFPDSFSRDFIWVLIGYQIFILLFFEKLIESAGTGL